MSKAETGQASSESDYKVDYDETGAGPTIVLVPGSCSTSAAWRPMISRWDNRFRCVTTSLLGYGGTTERRTPTEADISLEAETVEGVIRRAVGAVHLVGHSFGGLTALAVALRNKVPLLSLTIAEAPVPEILRHAGELQHYAAFRQMTETYIGAFNAGENAAIELMIDFYGGAGTFAGWPQRVRDYAVATTPVNILDWTSVYGFPLTSRLLATVDIQTLVLWGETSHPSVKRANELLSQCIPGASRAVIAGAAHFMISSHPADVADVVARHIARATQANNLQPAE
jgi:pimeloyl-ACP methyl ester carboxylesterase